MRARELPVTKAHAYGNDFLYTPWDRAEQTGASLADLARALCDRHEGIGADGFIVYREFPGGAAMRLTNADGSPSEVSGNGVRALAAILATRRGMRPRTGPDSAVTIDTDAGRKVLEFVASEGSRLVFRASMGRPEALRRVVLDVAGERFEAGALAVGNPQCVILAPLDEPRLARIGQALQRHAEFPEGVNVEMAHVEFASRVRILIWERGVGPTLSSGTGSCAAAVVAAAYGGSDRDVEVIAPGGSQRVEWSEDGIFLTGWAEVVFDGHWLR